MKEEGSRLEGRQVLVRPDASTSVAYINKGSGPSKVLSAIMRRIWDKCVQHGVTYMSLSELGLTGSNLRTTSTLSPFLIEPIQVSKSPLSGEAEEAANGEVTALARVQRNISISGQRQCQYRIRPVLLRSGGGCSQTSISGSSSSQTISLTSPAWRPSCFYDCSESRYLIFLVNTVPVDQICGQK